MKTKEFIKEMEEDLLTVLAVNDNYKIYDYGKLIAIVSRAVVGKFKIFNDGNQTVFDGGRVIKIIERIVSFTQTPIDLRDEEKKYYLRHRWMVDDNYTYLNFYVENNSYKLEDKLNMDEFKTQFTQAEIDEIKKRFNTTLEDFEMIEVKE